MIVFLQSQWRRFTVTLIFYVIYSHGWVWPLVQITDYIWIILLSYNIITIYHHCFIPAQWRRFTITVVDYYILKFFYDSSSWINATIFWDWWLHRKYFFEQSYYRYIDIMIADYIWSNLMSNLTLILSSLSLTIKIEKNGRWSICTESRISKLGVIDLSVVRFHLVHFSVQVTTWWWSKPSCGLIGAEGICIGFIDIVPSIGWKQ